METLRKGDDSCADSYITYFKIDDLYANKFCKKSHKKKREKFFRVHSNHKKPKIDFHALQA